MRGFTCAENSADFSVLVSVRWIFGKSTKLTKLSVKMSYLTTSTTSLRLSLPLFLFRRLSSPTQVFYRLVLVTVGADQLDVLRLVSSAFEPWNYMITMQ